MLFNKKFLLIHKDYQSLKCLFEKYVFGTNKEQDILNSETKSIYLVSKSFPQEITPILVKEFFTYKEKRYIIPRLGKPYARSTAKKSHFAAQKLNKIQQITPQIYASILFKKGIFHTNSIQFQEYIPNAYTFLDYYFSQNNTEHKIKTIQRASALLSALHSQKIGHLDFAGKNILINDKLAYFIDLDTVMFCKWKYNPLMLLYVVSDLNTFAKSILKRIGSLHTKYFFLSYAKERKWNKLKTRIIYSLLSKQFFSLKK